MMIESQQQLASGDYRSEGLAKRTTNKILNNYAQRVALEAISIAIGSRARAPPFTADISTKKWEKSAVRMSLKAFVAVFRYKGSTPDQIPRVNPGDIVFISGEMPRCMLEEVPEPMASQYLATFKAGFLGTLRVFAGEDKDVKADHTRLLLFDLVGNTYKHKPQPDAAPVDGTAGLPPVFEDGRPLTRLYWVLGEGSFGVTFRVEDIRDHTEVALKATRPPRSPEERAFFNNESFILTAVNHPNVLPAAGPPIEVQGGDLDGVIRRHLRNPSADPAADRTERWLLLGDMVRGLTYLHGKPFPHNNHRVLHNDMKPANVLLRRQMDPATKTERSMALLADLGLACVFTGGSLTYGLRRGTPGFMAPELFTMPGAPPGKGVDLSLRPGNMPATDVYALGVTLYCLYSQTDTDHKTDELPSEVELQKAFAEVAALEKAAGCPPKLAGLLMRMCSPDPTARPSMEKVAEALEETMARKAEVEARRKAEKEMEIILRFNLTQDGSSVTIPLKIRNKGSATLPPLSVAVLETAIFKSGAVATAAVPPHAEAGFSMTLEYKPFEWLGLRETDFQLTFVSGSYRTTVLYPAVVAAGPLLAIRHPAHGTTSRSSTSCKHPNDIVQPMIVLGGVDHATRSLKRLRFGEEGRTFNFNLWDTWGLTAETWNSMDLKRVMEGQFPENWEMSRRDAESVGQLVQGEATRHLRAPNAVIFVIPAADLGETVDASQVEMIRSTFAKLREHNPLLVVTKVDEIVPAFRANPWLDRHDPSAMAIARPGDPSAQLAALRQAASVRTGAPPDRIFLVCNYLQETRRCLNIELPLMAVMHEALLQAYSNARTGGATIGRRPVGLIGRTRSLESSP
ncbi:hypothetical protein PAPYR_7812 [Paratrimastix pyriformis]|uniref:Protein kinase domain-containing protein n=1 Tax=Paratrimastix pyriformis TaxID=342808 RepID=A0ABQ8UC78_9EUKA|nr:hypothetical protein PAPYR_7812 [Paratrimastix pyriformis]